MPFYKGAQKLFPDMSLKSLAPLCRELHMAWGIWRRHEKYTDSKGNSWSKEDFYNFWRSLNYNLKQKGGTGCVMLKGMPTSLTCVSCSEQEQKDLESLYKGIERDFPSMSLERLARFCLVLHMGWGTYRQFKNFTDVKGNEWKVEDFRRVHKVLDEQMKKKGGKGCKPFNPFDEPATKRETPSYPRASSMSRSGKCQALVLKNGRLATMEDYDEICFCDGTCVDMDSRNFEATRLELDGHGANRLLTRDATPELKKAWLSEGVDVRYVDEELEQMNALDDSEMPIKFFLVGAERREISKLADGVMLNAVQIKQAKQLEPWRSEFRGQIMLDNGIFGDTLLNVDELVGRVHSVMPDIAVGPDVLYDRDIHIKSLKRQKEFLSKKLPKEVSVMLVPQGNTCLEFEWCTKQILKMKPEVIGLGRMSMKVAGYPGRGHKQRIYALKRLQDLGILDEIKSEGIRMHALGLSKPWELPYLNKFGFYSIDSMSYIYSSLYNQLAMPGDPTEMSFSVVNGQVKQTRNIEDDVHSRRAQFVKEYPHSGSLDARQWWIVQNVWKPMSKMKATDYHIMNSVRDLKFEDRDDKPMLEKPTKEGLSHKVYQTLQNDQASVGVPDVDAMDVAKLSDRELHHLHHLMHVAWKQKGAGGE